MTPRKIIALAAGAAVLSLPLVAAAQSWSPYGGQYGGQYAGGDYGYGRGGYVARFEGFPEFRGLKAHIRQEMRQGLREGWLDGEEARDINVRLWRVQQQEFREFQEHGWSLPGEDRAEIRADLSEIDAMVDRARDGDGDRAY